MATFTVHVPPRAATAALRAERTIFVRDGFSWAAFLFGPLFLLYRRLWLAAVVWVVAATTLVVLGRALHVPPGALASLFLLLAGLTGLEASALRQASLDRRGFVPAELLSRGSREEAERAFFAADPAVRSAADPTAVRSPGPGAAVHSLIADDEVIGLFPRSGDVG